MQNQRQSDLKKFGTIEGVLSIVVNTLLFGLKYWVGVTSGSVALIADAWHTLSDSISSVIVLFGIKVSTKPPDKEHPFGHGRFELIASIIIGVLLAIVGFNFMVEAIQKLQNHEQAEFGMLAIVVTIISVVLKEAMAQYAMRVGKKTGSTAIKADGWHHRADAISSAVILVGILVGPYYWWMDGLLGILIALFIFYTAYEIMKDSIGPLLGEEPEDETLKRLEMLAAELQLGDLMIHHVHQHTYGNHTELTFHIELPGDLPLSQVHDITDQLEKMILMELQMYATIHADPSVPIARPGQQ